MMKDDPAIRIIREVRHKISEECEHNPKKLVEYYMKRQRERAQSQEEEKKAVTAEKEA